MKLVEHLERTGIEKLSLISASNNIYFDSNFSKRWLSSEISKKLLDSDYLDNLIEKRLSTNAKGLIKRLITTQSINKNSLDKKLYKQLIGLGIIYDDNEFCHLPWDLKEVLTRKLKEEEKVNISKHKTKKIKLSANKKESKIKIPFSTYLILSLAYLDKLEDEISRKSKLSNYLEEINRSNLSTDQLLNYILHYSYKKRLLKGHLELSNHFKTWLNKEEEEVALDLITLFFPQNYKELKKIIAVLIYYPKNKTIPIKFINEEFRISFNEKEEELLQLLNIFDLTKNNLTLSSFIWDLFNSESNSNYSPFQISGDKVLVSPKIRAKPLWTIAKNSSLHSIDDRLEFKIKEEGIKFI